MGREVLTAEDLAEMFDVSKDTAYDYIRGIRSVSDTLGIAGKVHKQDYEYWLQIRLGQTKKDRKQ